jgi:FkbM family methyltransferase
MIGSRIFKIVRVYKNPINYYKAYLNLGNRETVGLRNGLYFSLRPHKQDLATINEVYLFKDYDIALRNLNKNSLVIDIGAHIGTFSIAASLRAKKIYSFEPEKENFSFLEENVSLNKRKNIVPINKAVSNIEGSAFLYLSPSNSGGNSLIKRFNQRQKIGTINLNKFIERNKIRNISLLKIDTEGHELAILDSLKRGTVKKIDAIVIEFHEFEKTYKRGKLLCWLKKHKFVTRHLEEYNASTGLIYADRQS